MKSALGLPKDNTDDASKKPKNISVSDKFKAISDIDQLKEKVVKLSNELSQRCIENKLQGRSLAIELKTTKHQIIRRTNTNESYMYKQEDFVI